MSNHDHDISASPDEESTRRGQTREPDVARETHDHAAEAHPEVAHGAELRHEAGLAQWAEFRAGFEEGLDQPWSESVPDEAKLRQGVTALLARTDVLIREVDPGSGRELIAASGPSLVDAVETQLLILRQAVEGALVDAERDPGMGGEVSHRIEESLSERESAIVALFEGSSRGVTVSAIPEVALVNALIKELDENVAQPWPELGADDDVRIRDALRGFGARAGDILIQADPGIAPEVGPARRALGQDLAAEIATQIELLRASVGGGMEELAAGRLASDELVAAIDASLRVQNAALDAIEARLQPTPGPEVRFDSSRDVLASQVRTDPASSAQWDAAWHDNLGALQRELDRDWGCAPAVQAEVKARMTAVIEEASRLRASLDQLEPGEELGQIRALIGKAVQSPMSATEASRGRSPDDAASLVRVATVNAQRLLDQADARLLTAVLQKGEAAGHLELDQLRLAERKTTTYDFGHEVSSVQAQDLIDAARSGIEDLQAHHAALAPQLEELERRVGALRERLKTDELSPQVVAERVVAQASAANEASRGLDAVNALLQRAEPGSDGAAQLSAVRELYAAALVYSDDASSTSRLLAEADRRMQRYVVTDGLDNARQALEGYDAGLRAIYAREGVDTTLDVVASSTVDQRRDLRMLSAARQADDARALHEAVDAASAALERGDLAGATQQLRDAQVGLANMGGRFRLIGDLDQVLQASEGVSTSSLSVTSTLPFITVDTDLGQARKALFDLVERYELDADPASRRRVLQDGDQMWHQVPGGKELFAGLQTAMSGLIAPGDPARAAMVAETLGRLRELVEAGKLDEAAEHLDATLSAALQVARPRVEASNLDRERPAIVEAVRQGKLAQAGEALESQAKADFARLDPEELGRAHDALGALWNRRGADELAQRAYGDSDLSDKVTRVGVAVVATAASMGLGSVVTGAGNALLGTGVVATNASLPATLAVGTGALAAESLAYTFAERASERYLIGSDARLALTNPELADEQPGFLAQWAENAAMFGAMKGVGHAWESFAEALSLSKPTRWAGEIVATTGAMTTADLVADLAQNRVRPDLGEIASSFAGDVGMNAVIAVSALIAKPMASAIEVKAAEAAGLSPELRAIERKRAQLTSEMEDALRTGQGGAVLGRLTAEVDGLERTRHDVGQRLLDNAASLGWNSKQIEALKTAVDRQSAVATDLGEFYDMAKLGIRPPEGMVGRGVQLYDPKQTENVKALLARMKVTDVVDKTLPDGRHELSGRDVDGAAVRLVEAREARPSAVLEAHQRYTEFQELRDQVRKEILANTGPMEQVQDQVLNLLDRWQLEGRKADDIQVRREAVRDMIRNSAQYTAEDLLLAAGLEEWPSQRQATASHQLIVNHGSSWADLRDAFRAQPPGVGKAEMFLAIQYRKAATDQILEVAVDNVQKRLAAMGFQVEIKWDAERGSLKFTSDRDVSVEKLGAELVVKEFNEEFRKRYGLESGTFFDTNIYTEPVYTLYDAATADQARVRGRSADKTDARQQFVYAEMAMCGKLSATEWKDYTAELQTAARAADARAARDAGLPPPTTPGDRQQLIIDITQRAEQARNGGEELLKAAFKEMGVNPAQATADQRVRARNDAYGEILEGIGKIRLEEETFRRWLNGGMEGPAPITFLKGEGEGTENSQYRRLLQGVEAARSSGNKAAEAQAIQKTLSWFAAQARNRQGMALFLAPEAYQTAGSFKHVVLENQANETVPSYESLMSAPSGSYSPEEYLNSIVENAAFRQEMVAHTGRNASGALLNPAVALEKAAKYAYRELDGAHKAGVDLAALGDSNAHGVKLDDIARYSAALEAARGNAAATQRIVAEMTSKMSIDDFVGAVEATSPWLTIEALEHTRLGPWKR